MSQDDWQTLLESSQKTALMQDGRRKVHYTFSSGMEMAEEYDAKTDELLIRKWRKKGTLGDTKPWEVEVGETATAPPLQKDSGFMESMTNPVCVRRDKSEAFQWRIRNLPYPIDTYKLSIEDNKIVVRTTNKKYFKKVEITDMDRLKLALDAEALTYAHANNTLLITYNKPAAIRDFEKALIKRLKKLKSDGDVDQCKQQ